MISSLPQSAAGKNEPCNRKSSDKSASEPTGRSAAGKAKSSSERRELGKKQN